jgi:hypothetical protein
MENMEKPQENPNVRPEINSESENFDANGNTRSNRAMPDGTVSFLSEQEYTNEIENQRN